MVATNTTQSSIATARSSTANTTTTKKKRPSSSKSSILPFFALFSILLSTRVYYTLTLPVMDCDETFNYWEPTFALLQQHEQSSVFRPFNAKMAKKMRRAIEKEKAIMVGGQEGEIEDEHDKKSSILMHSYFGKQTWEYAPQFALRSWFFLWLYAWPAVVVREVVGRIIVPTMGWLSSSPSAASSANSNADGVSHSSNMFYSSQSQTAISSSPSSSSLSFLAPFIAASSIDDMLFAFVDGFILKHNIPLPPVLRESLVSYSLSHHRHHHQQQNEKNSQQQQKGVTPLSSSNPLFTTFTFPSLTSSSTTAAGAADDDVVILLDSVFIYFLCKVTAACVGAVAEMYFILAVGRRFGWNRNYRDEANDDDDRPSSLSSPPPPPSFFTINLPAFIAFCVTAFSTGTTVTAISFLPSSFATLCYYVALGSWLIYDDKGRCGGNTKNSSSSTNSSTAVTSVQKMREQQLQSEHLADFQAAHASYLLLAGIIAPVVAAIVVGWPFAGLVAVPIALDVLYHDGIVRPLIVSIQSVIVLGGAVLVGDVYYYGKLVWSPLQLVVYNVFGGKDKGPELYGVEPWNFFFKNLFLNFNLIFVLGLVAPVVICLARLLSPQKGSLCGVLNDRTRSIVNGEGEEEGTVDAAVARRLALLKEQRAREARGEKLPPNTTTNATPSTTTTAMRTLSPLPLSVARQLLYISPFFLWFAFWMRIPHKEERFMCPAYPFLVLSATMVLLMGVRMGRGGVGGGRSPTPSATSTTTTVSSLFFFALFSLTSLGALGFASAISQLRLLAIVDNYSGLQSAAIVTRQALSLRSRSSRRGSMTAAASSSSTLEKVGDGVEVGKGEASPRRRVKTLCVGVDWYRYPSSFFLPPPSLQQHRSGEEKKNKNNFIANEEWRYCFLKTKAFTGALPLDFKTSVMKIKKEEEEGEGSILTPSSSSPASFMFDAFTSVFSSSTIRSEMNDLNQEVFPIQYCGGEAEGEGGHPFSSFNDRKKKKKSSNKKTTTSEEEEAKEEAEEDQRRRVDLNVNKALSHVCDAVMDTNDALITLSRDENGNNNKAEKDDDNDAFNSWSIVDGTITSETRVVVASSSPSSSVVIDGTAATANDGEQHHHANDNNEKTFYFKRISASSSLSSHNTEGNVQQHYFGNRGAILDASSSFVKCRAVWLGGFVGEAVQKGAGLVRKLIAMVSKRGGEEGGDGAGVEGDAPLSSSSASIREASCLWRPIVIAVKTEGVPPPKKDE